MLTSLETKIIYLAIKENTTHPLPLNTILTVRHDGGSINYLKKFIRSWEAGKELYKWVTAAGWNEQNIDDMG